jgi:ParB-like chromosome segregation protein Spo0J
LGHIQTKENKHHNTDGMQMHDVKMELEQVPMTSVFPYARNARTHDEDQIRQIASSIKEFGFTNPILIDESGLIIAGHGRVLAAQHLQMQSIPAIRFHHLNPVQKQALTIADNKLALNAGWDEDMLKSELIDLHESGYNMEVLGFTPEELTDLMGLLDDNEQEEDDVPSAPKEPQTKLGDVWILGDHKLICGDCTDSSVLAKLMQNEKARMVFTDPPYDMTNEDAMARAIQNVTEDAHVFVMHDDRGVVKYLKQSQLVFKQFFVARLGFSSWRGNDPYCEHILVSHEVNGHAIKHQNLHDGFSSVIKMEYRTTLKEDEVVHKMQKPVSFVSKFVQHYSQSGDLVVDLYAGSGTTIMACQESGRRCNAVELDPSTCDVIVARFKKKTGIECHKES